MGYNAGAMHHPHRKKRHTGKWLTFFIILGLCAGVILAAASKKKDAPYEFIAVERGDIVQSVGVTGRVLPEERVELGFEEGGRVQRIWKKEGEQVSRGEALIELDVAKISAELLEAEAAVQAARAKFDELARGPRLEDIRVKESEVKKVEQELLNSYGSVLQALEDAYAKADDAVRIKTTNLFGGGASGGYTFQVDACDSAAKESVASLRGTSELSLREWRSNLTFLSGDAEREVFDAELKGGDIRLGVFREFLGRTSDAINTDCLLGNSSLDTARKNVSAARDEVLLALQALRNVEQDIQTAKRTFETKERELDLKRAGVSPEEIRGQETRVEEAEARSARIRARKEGFSLRAPFHGIITEVRVKNGEIVSSGVPFLVLISKGSPKVEAYVPESDIAKIQKGDTAEITLDAYAAEEVFPAKVLEIAPAETMLDGVATYKVTLRFTREDVRIKPGMTADTDIITAVRNGALFVPQRAFITEGGKKYVRVLTEKGIERVRVETGIKGSEGTIEITEGLEEGDKVILFIEE